MSLITPTTTDISNNIIAQLEGQLSQTIPLLPKAFNRVLAKVLAGVFILLYKYGGFIFLQMFVAFASDKETTVNGKIIVPLNEWGILIGIGEPVGGTNAELLIDVTVENQTGSLSSGSQLVNTANGVTYITIGSVLLDAPTVQATIRAVADQADGGGVGALGNLEPSDEVSFANALPNVARVATVDSQVVTAANKETTTAYRQRIVDRFQRLPQGGALVDYHGWGVEESGIINIFVYTSDNPGEVDVYAEATVLSSGNADGIPTQAQLDAVEASINLDDSGLASRRPANAGVNVFGISRTGFDSTVIGLQADNLASVQQDIDDAIVEFFLNAEPFIDGLTLTPRKDNITRSALIGLVNDIVSSVNGSFTTVRFNLTGVSGSRELYILGQGEKSKSTGVNFA